MDLVLATRRYKDFGLVRWRKGDFGLTSAGGGGMMDLGLMNARDRDF